MSIVMRRRRGAPRDRGRRGRARRRTKAVEDQIERESDAFVASGELLGRRHHRPPRHPHRARHGTVGGLHERGRGLAALRRLPDVDDRLPTRARPFAKVLVANRGEIARRIFARLPRGWASRPSPSTPMPTPTRPSSREADEAVALGGTTAAESYLRRRQLLDAARRDRRRRHPSRLRVPRRERRVRPRRASTPGWSGSARRPRRSTAMGSQDRRQRLMADGRRAAAPGAELDERRTPTLRAEAERIGFPLLVKASAGGGGKGMRIVASLGRELDAAVEARAPRGGRRLRRRHGLPRALPRSGRATSRSRSSATPTATPSPRRARVLDPAPPSEDHRRVAVAGGRRRAARAARRGCRRRRPRRSATSAPAPSSSCSARPASSTSSR